MSIVYIMYQFQFNIVNFFGKQLKKIIELKKKLQSKLSCSTKIKVKIIVENMVEKWGVFS
jgi:hypothetical protein